MSKSKKNQTKPYQRAPIVTIMGHVDHGKTTLLDAIRESKIVDKEHGGITQHIGAYQIQYQDNPITFIDTPGHAAFSKMRARGAKVTDIVVLVVAADDGIKPQTVESIKHIKKAESHLIVAINKMDVVGASADMVKAQLTEHEVFVEGYGGQVPAVEISAKTKKGLDQLLEMIVLVSQVEELDADPEGDLEAIIIESHLDKKRGSSATVIVRNGTLTVSQNIYIGESMHKIKALYNDTGSKTDQALPGQPVEILGFKSVPDVGEIVTQHPTIKKVTEKVEIKEDEDNTQPPSQTEEEDEKPTMKIILKADTSGTLEAIIQSISQDEIIIVDRGIGVISESDILLSQSTNAEIIGFNVSVSSSAKKLASIEKIEILNFNIIYKLIEYIEKRVLKLIEPTIDQEEHGTATITTIFEIKGDKIAGCKVNNGYMQKGALAHIIRDKEIVADAKIKSLKQGKLDVDKVSKGSECGIVLTPQVDFEPGDSIITYIIKKEV